MSAILKCAVGTILGTIEKDVNITASKRVCKQVALRDLDGERGRNRTFNLLIKSQLLCQLSYAPGRITEGGTTFDYNIGDERFRRWSPVINWNLPQIYSLVK